MLALGYNTLEAPGDFHHTAYYVERHTRPELFNGNHKRAFGLSITDQEGMHRPAWGKPVMVFGYGENRLIEFHPVDYEEILVYARRNHSSEEMGKAFEVLRMNYPELSCSSL